MIDRIRELQRRSAALEPDSRGRRSLRVPVMAYAESFLRRIDDLPAYVVTADKGAGLLESPIGEDPIPVGAALELLREHVDRPGLNPASGGHLGYIPGGGIYAASLGDYLAAVTNRYAGVFYASPGAVRMENQLIRWMAGLVGYPPTAGGNLASGGSIANLAAIVTARDARPKRGVLYMTEHAHHCIDKALRIAGLGRCERRFVPMDSRWRMNAGALERAVRRDRRAGRRPWLVIAAAGTTDTGAVDPLVEIGRIARNFGLWYHIDGAYGAFFALTRAGRELLRGMELSDSIVMDPHKGLFLPYGLGVVLVKDRDGLRRSHRYEANYLRDARESVEEDSPADLSPELTKHFRGLRLWLPLKLHGVRPFRAALEEKLLLARYFHREVRKLGYEAGPEPALSVVTYRWPGTDEENLRIQREIMEDGRVFISSTVLSGRVTLRFAALSFRTHLKTVDLLLELLAARRPLLRPSRRSRPGRA
jgi:glutamate/tyrosine decarboxylase-like PLP-dependent enzyme